MSGKKNDFINNRIVIDTSTLDTYQGLINHISTKDMLGIMSTSISKTMKGYLDCVRFIDYSSYTKTISDILGTSFQSILQTNDYSRYVKSITDNLSAYMDMTETIQKITHNIFSSYEGIFSSITSIPKEEFDIMLDGTNFTREDVLEDIDHFENEVSETCELENVTENVLPEEKLNAYLKDHPALAHIYLVVCIIIWMLSNGQLANDTFLPVVQNAIVAMQGNENIYFVKVDSAKIYAEPSSYSSVTRQIPYGERVTLIESAKLWNKVTYTNSEKEEIVGWIAKRNLMTYCDYQFNSDELYGLD